MIEIIPAILPKDYEDLKNKIALVRGAVPIVQVDICDGIFVSSKTWPFSTGGANDYNFCRILNEQEGMPFWEDIDFELDLMVADAIENFDVYTKLGAKKIVFHLEAIGDLKDFQSFLEGIDIYTRDIMQIGIAINPSTPVEQIFPLISCADFVQCMGNDKIGQQGISLDEQVYEKIKVFREKYSDLPIAVDIGVNEKTAPLLIKAGATKLIIGSTIFNTEDIIETIEEFKSLG
jgi:ribulose-phosphate 3-epimerase